MKKTYLALISLAFIAFSPGLLAQQQINNNGAATGGELQPQSQNIQNNAGSERYSSEDITRDVANSDVLKNAQVNNLTVVGAPANESTQQPSRSFVGWLILAFGILLVLMAPALIYARDYKNQGGLTKAAGAPAEDISELTAAQEVVTEVTENAQPEVKQENKVDKPKKKSKKKPGNKAKRGKKKKK
jgi:hypothetical protein